MKKLLWLLLALALPAAAQQTPEQTWGQYLYKLETPAPKSFLTAASPLDPHWQVAGYGPTPKPVCTTLRDIWIMPDGSYRYCIAGTYANPFASISVALATSSQDGLLSHLDFANLHALQSAAYQPSSAFDLVGSATAAQAAAISTAQSNTASAIAALSLGTAAKQATSAFDLAGSAASAQASAVSTAQSNMASAIAALNLGSASQQPVAAFDPSGAAASAQSAAVSTAQTNTTSAIAALLLKSASQHLATDFDSAGAAASAQISAISTAQSNAASAIASAIGAQPIATASTNGLLSKADWSTFNSKQNSIGFTPLSPSANLSELSNPVAARTNLGLGSAATQPATAFDAAGAAATAVAGLPLSARSGSYADLTSKPTIPAAQVASDWNATSGIAAILNKPTLGTASAQASTAFDAAGAATAAQSAAVSTAQTNTNNAITALGLKSASQQLSSAFDAAGAASSAVAALPTAARSGSYTDLTNKPTLGSAAAANTSAFDAAGAASTAQSASLQKSSNLSDLASASTAQSNLLGAWQSWTPVVTPLGSMTASNITVADAQYLRMGPLCFFKFSITLTLGGTMDVGIYFSAPVPPVGVNSAVTSLVNQPGNSYYNPAHGRTDATYGFLFKTGNPGTFNAGQNVFLMSGMYRVQ